MSKNAQWRSLAHAVRIQVVLRYLGQLALALALLNLVPMLVAWVSGDALMARRYLWVTLLLVAGGMATRGKAPDATIQANEAWVVTALAFIAAALVGSYPLTAAGLSWIDALFESLSGVTTTGLSVVAEPESMPFSFLFARAWMQWFGGLGIVVLSVALLLGHGLVARQLMEHEGGNGWDTSALQHARQVLVIYLLLTAVGLALVLPLSGKLSDGFVHVLAAVSTGGFGIYRDSLGGVIPSVALLLSLLSIVSALALPLFYAAYRQGIGRFLRDTELRALLMLLLAVVAAMAVLLHLEGYSWRDALWHAGMVGVSAQTTSGFTTLASHQLMPPVMLLLIFAMFVGGSLGSTAGGIKLTRLLILLQVVRRLLRRSTVPSHGVVNAWLGERQLEYVDIERALIVILLYLVTVAASWFVFVLYGYPPLESLFDVVSAVGTVGLSSGVTSAELPQFLKIVLCFDMLAGRVEVIALLVLLYPRSWIGRRQELT